MTPLRFRAWHKGDSECDIPPHMLYDVQYIYDGYNGGFDRDDDPHSVLGGMESFGELIEDKQFIVMQSTGLKDRTGKEIFDGDVLKYRYDVSNFYADKAEWKEGTGTVTWEERDDFVGFKLCCHDLARAVYASFRNAIGSGMRENCVEIIGNIYENPDLLDPPSP